MFNSTNRIDDFSGRARVALGESLSKDFPGQFEKVVSTDGKTAFYRKPTDGFNGAIFINSSGCFILQDAFCGTSLESKVHEYLVAQGNSGKVIETTTCWYEDKAGRDDSWKTF